MVSQGESRVDHELRFQSLFNPNRAFGFPCSSDGTVDVRALTARACSNYLLARASIGRDYAQPSIVSRYVHGGALDS